jgi:16S rRNA (adenine1518-N6/adenine1519-N6)-dimethyltransferase
MIRAKKSLGQNFLIDKNIINKIIESGSIENKNVLEIGPGTGNLTDAILKKKPKKLVVIEKDAKLSSNLREKYNNQIEVINDDVLNINEKKIINEKFVVFGNLPYNISTEILCKWILNLDKNKFWFTELILMFQKEVADRILAKFNTSEYGRLAILANWKLKIKKISDISAESFYPKPKIESTLLYFLPKNDFVDFDNSKNLEKITRIFFSQRRKMLRKPYKQIFSDNVEIIDKLNIDLNLRPQNLSLDVYYKLVKEYEKLNS